LLLVVCCKFVLLQVRFAASSIDAVFASTGAKPRHDHPTNDRHVELIGPAQAARCRVQSTRAPGRRFPMAEPQNSPFELRENGQATRDACRSRAIGFETVRFVYKKEQKAVFSVAKK
jgi:hypothetical protein